MAQLGPPRWSNPAPLFRCFESSPEVIRLVVVVMYVTYPLSLRNLEGTVRLLRQPQKLTAWHRDHAAAVVATRVRCAPARNWRKVGRRAR